MNRYYRLIKAFGYFLAIINYTYIYRYMYMCISQVNLKSSPLVVYPSLSLILFLSLTLSQLKDFQLAIGRDSFNHRSSRGLVLFHYWSPVLMNEVKQNSRAIVARPLTSSLSVPFCPSHFLKRHGEWSPDRDPRRMCIYIKYNRLFFTS